MDEFINTAHKKQSLPKPPISVGRIVGEIMVGAATAATSAAIVYSFFYAVGYCVNIADLGEEGCMGNIVLWVIAALMFMCVPPLYLLGCTIGVYFVGSRGNQTGSLLATFGGSFLGMFVMALLLFYIGASEKYGVMLGREKIILWPLVFIAAPVMATLIFNLTRRYKDRKHING